MSLVHGPVAPDHLLSQPSLRKRTFSFSVAASAVSASPRPSKAPRTSRSSAATTMGLRRTESYLHLPAVVSPPPQTCRSPPHQQQQHTVPYHQSLQYYKDQRQRWKAAVRAGHESITIRTRIDFSYPPQQVQQSSPPPAAAAAPPSSSPPPRRTQSTPKSTPTSTSSPSSSPSPSPPRSRALVRTAALLDVTAPPPSTPEPLSSTPLSEDTDSDTARNTPFYIPPTCRASSPLSPNRRLLPGRPVFPRSKPEPDLYRKAITTCMRSSPEGQQILRMGPRLALSILTATRELEKIVAEQEDVVMEDRTAALATSSHGGCEATMMTLSSSWIDVKSEDWEMVDCAA